jgi:hypothetical protein
MAVAFLVAALAQKPAWEVHFARPSVPFTTVYTGHSPTWPYFADPDADPVSRQLLVAGKKWDLFLYPEATMIPIGTTKDGWTLVRLETSFSGAITIWFSDILAYKEGRLYLLPNPTLTNEIVDADASGRILVRSTQQHASRVPEPDEVRNDKGYVWHGAKSWESPDFNEARLTPTGAAGTTNARPRVVPWSVTTVNTRESSNLKMRELKPSPKS